VKGFTHDGHEVTLLPWQEDAVRDLLEWDSLRGVRLMPAGRGGGKSVILATAAAYDKAYSSSRPLPDDPRMQEDGEEEAGEDVS
jgi:hypothetical protein